MTLRVGLIILAAGASSRMGTLKQLLPYKGTTLLTHAINTALAASCRPIVVVLGASADQTSLECAALPVICVVNSHWEEGIGASIRCGINSIQTIDPQVSGVVIMLCDQPKVNRDTIESLMLQHTEHNAELAACEYGGSVGVPALFSRIFFDELYSLDGEKGAKKVLLANLQAVRRLPFEAGMLDIDTPLDYNELLGPNVVSLC